MLNYLMAQHIGPTASLELSLGRRINLITGENGLGKSFVLDLLWWALTRKWPAELNPQLTSGQPVRPPAPQKSLIRFRLSQPNGERSYEAQYQPRDQQWVGGPERPLDNTLVVYSMVDGSFAVWDPARNYWRHRDGQDHQDRPPAYVFSPKEVWEGLKVEGSWQCNGLIRDWASWQLKKNRAYAQLCAVLGALGPEEGQLEPGELTRISLDDVRDMPTLRMPYGQDVPVVFASAGLKRMMAFAYLLAWTWDEHRKAVAQLGEEPATDMMLLVDELESHLHPSWQRRMLPALMAVNANVAEGLTLQVVATTHSPLVMTSLEPLFDPNQDTWFDFKLVRGTVALQSRPFRKHGDAGNWLTSEAFGLASGRPPNMV